MLNKTLKYFRTSHKMTQETLALKLGVTRQTVSKWENGISVPDADTLNKMADIFEVSISELLGTDKLLDKNKKQSDGNNENEHEKMEDEYIAEALAIINEQLAVKNRHRKTMIRIIKIVLIILGITMVLPVLCILAYVAFLALAGL